jgi:hypothetical protein
MIERRGPLPVTVVLIISNSLSTSVRPRSNWRRVLQVLEQSCVLALLIGGLFLCSANMLWAATVSDFTLQDNGWIYRESLINDPSLREKSLSTAGVADFIDPSGINHFTQNWWWYRVDGDQREYALTNQTTFLQIAPNRIGMEYSEKAQGLGINNAVLFGFDYRLDASNPNRPFVIIDVVVKNTTDQNRTVNFFSYFDPSLNGTQFDDTAKLTFADRSKGSFTTAVTDPIKDGYSASISSQVLQGGEFLFNSHSQIAEGTGLWEALTNNSLTTLNDNATEATGDVSGAYQWSFSLNANQVSVVRLTKTLTVPEANSLLLLTTGLGVLFITARRKTRAHRRGH